MLRHWGPEAGTRTHAATKNGALTKAARLALPATGNSQQNSCAYESLRSDLDEVRLELAVAGMGGRGVDYGQRGSGGDLWEGAWEAKAQRQLDGAPLQRPQDDAGSCSQQECPPAVCLSSYADHLTVEGDQRH
jgi:hypothetical protein